MKTDSYKIVKAPRILTAIGKKYGLVFDKKYHYYTGDPYVNNKGETLPCTFKGMSFINSKGRQDDVYKLKYLDGCFKSYLVQIMDNDS